MSGRAALGVRGCMGECTAGFFAACMHAMTPRLACSAGLVAAEQPARGHLALTKHGHNARCAEPCGAARREAQGRQVHARVRAPRDVAQPPQHAPRWRQRHAQHQFAPPAPRDRPQLAAPCCQLWHTHVQRDARARRGIRRRPHGVRARAGRPGGICAAHFALRAH